MKTSLSLVVLSLLTLTAALAAAQEAGPLGERKITVGKWPEGVVVTDAGAWVAESGERKLTLYDRDGKASKRAAIGRLPTDMATDKDGALIALVVTDKQLKRVDPKTGKVKPLTKLPDYGEAMIAGEGVAHVLLWEKDSSADSSVLRVDLKGTKPRRSAKLGKDAWGLCQAGEEILVAHTDRLSRLDAQTLAVSPAIALPGYWRELACDATAAFVAGGPTLVRLDAARKESARVTMERRVAAMALRADALFVALDNGEVLKLDPATLKITARRAPAAPLSPHALVLEGDSLWMTSYTSEDFKAPTGDLIQAPLF